MNRIVFLGSGGGGLITSSQMRKTGGLYVEFGDFSFGLDPGPGALVHSISLGLAPGKWKGLVISHHHLDAINDANAIIDAMKEEAKNSKDKNYPFLIAEEHCLKAGKEKDDPYPYITKYHQSSVKKLLSAAPGFSSKIDKLEIKAAKSHHYTPTIGYVFRYESKKIGYPADGSYYRGQEKFYDGCDILILNVPWPKGHDAPPGFHMNLDDAIEFVREMKNKPKLVVLSHFSPFIIRANLFKQEKILQDATKVRCISADDFLELDLDTLKTRMLVPKK